ncbi:MAG: transcription-repair coupling factor, partial [Planctomycetaceae bacterium]|nr:transcription-repair coupling factor [Planctomycetaceae bacterium]
MASSGGGADSLADLPARLERWPAVENVLAALARGESGTIDGAWGSSCALLAGAIAAKTPGTLLVVLPRISDVDDFATDLAWYLPAPPVVLSAWDGRPGERSIADPVFSARLQVLQLLGGEPERGQRSAPHPGPLPAEARGEEGRVAPRVVVASLAALMQPVPARQERQQATRRISRGETLDVDDLLQWLVDRGFERASAIERAGEFSVHGGIIDIFAPGSDDPVRIELFGDEVESLRSFDAETQRKVAALESTELIALAPAGADAAEREELFLESLPAGSWVALVEPEELTAEGDYYLQRLGSPEGLFGVAEVLAKCTARPSVTISAVSGASYDATAHLQIESVERFSGRKSEAFRELEGVLSPTEAVLIACHNLAERERLHELLLQSVPQLRDRTRLCIGTVTRGFRLVSEKLLVLSDHELFGRVDIRRAARRRRPEGRAIDSFLDLSPGDLVVHLAHGIGRFRGLELVKRGVGAGGMNAPAAFRKEGEDKPALEEHLVLEFRDGVRIFVPVSLIHLVQKYVGPAKGTP